MKCPNCGGPLVYDIESDMMKCSYCDGSSSKESGKMYTDYHPQFAPETPDIAPIKDYMEMNIYHCSSCGADLMVGQTQASTFCSYCGSPSIVYERVSKEEKPSKIIPFKLSESQALACIKDRFGYGSYIPPQIRNLTPKEVRAIYIPFWLYTAYIRKNVTLKVNRNDGQMTCFRDVSCTYHNVTMDGSLRLSNDFSKRLEPYYMNELEDFDIAYLSGFYADKYDVPYDALTEQVKKRCKNFLNGEILRSCPGANYALTKSGKIANYTESNAREEYELKDITYALLPAYFVNVEYESGKQLIIVNGQTGKVIGNIPFEKEQFLKMFVKNGLISCTVFSLLSILFLSIPALKLLFLLLVLIVGIYLFSGIKGYRKYKLGLLQLASQHMNSYATRKED